MKNFKTVYSALLYACIFLTTLVVIFTPFWIVGEAVRTWTKDTPFNWWCIAIWIGSFMSLIIAMSLAGVKTKEQIEAMNPLNQNSQGGNSIVLVGFFLLFLCTGCAEPSGTTRLVSHPQDSIRVYEYWTTNGEKIYIARFIGTRETTTTWFEWRHYGKGNSRKVPHYTIESAP